MPRRQIGKLNSTDGEKRVSANEKRVGPVLRECRKGLVDLADTAGIEDLYLQPHGTRSGLQLVYLRLGTRGIGLIDKHGHTHCFWYQLAQEFQPLGQYLACEEIDARHVASRPGEARDETQLHRVLRDAEHDRDGCV